MATQDEAGRNEAPDRERDRERRAARRDPDRLAPMQGGRGDPRGRAHQGTLGHAPQDVGPGQYGWGGDGGLYEVLLPAGALLPNHAGRGPRGYTRADERIVEEINDRLTWHPDIDASRIDVSVRHGVATLAGTVDSRIDKHLARDIAEGVDGVKVVRNKLRIPRRS